MILTDCLTQSSEQFDFREIELMQQRKPVVLMILDGWGIREFHEGNAVTHANTPNYNYWLKHVERSVVDASGEAVGLVAEQMGNSEVGHLNLGAGRIIYQDILRIDKSIKDRSFFELAGLVKAANYVKSEKKKLHLIGLLTTGGVHAHTRHLYALLDLCDKFEIEPIVHVITDGRDMPSDSGLGLVEELEARLARTGNGRIATVSGRYYAMDRDKRWERTGWAFNTMTLGQTDRVFESASACVKAAYAEKVTDEFVKPAVVSQKDGKEVLLTEGDAVIIYNFRADRQRQTLHLLYNDNEHDEQPTKAVKNAQVFTFTEYVGGQQADIIFPSIEIKNTLAEVISKAGMRQYHIAETEKYPHVTYFFNGGVETPYPGEEHVVVPSPKVATYDLKPEMSAYELTETLSARIDQGIDDFILVNFANPDMVGHTGSLAAATKAVETVDECAGKLVKQITAKGGIALVTADHGNCEVMVDEATGKPHTYHTTNPVSFFVIGNQPDEYFTLRPRAILGDVAPTVLKLLGIEQPADMTGVSIVVDVNQQ